MSTGVTYPNLEAWNTVCCFLRLPQLFCTCMAFSLVADMGISRGDIGNWSMSIWGFCFAVTLIIVTVEFFDFESRFPFFWYNLSITYACYATLLCLLASSICSITYVQFLPDGPLWDRAVAAAAVSCVASALYAIDVAFVWSCYEFEEITCYVHTVPGLLKVLETFTTGIIFTFLGNTSLYLHQPALEWCMAVYSICFILAALAMLLKLGGWENILPVPFPIFQLGLTLFSILLYISALVLWLLYQFYEEFGGQPQWSSDISCFDDLMCTWIQRLAVAILTAINLLIYVADLVYCACQGFYRD
ncbi:myeloid-associated differentiation marker-like [Budorcas taxicolor]|uniref:myeloid-associated differentiation marker-like n=1 Tax=Budorcas taxicolor TaxID=37181 RepID=UPI0022843A4F|nr:myeloid-associated differentiation marker-like [Budorcas taxicolor]